MTRPSLRPIVAALGGDLYAGETRANIPSPGHSRADRSVSLLLSRGRVVVHCFGDGDWRAVVADLERRGFVDAQGRLRSSIGPIASGDEAARPAAAARAARARSLWEEARPLTGVCLASRHLRLRGLVRPEAALDLACHPGAPLAVFRPTSRRAPALIAAIRDPAGGLTAVEITYLGPNARRLVGVGLSRKTVGAVPTGSAVRLCAVGVDHLVGEGVATVMSASARFGRPGWALLSARNLAAWIAPPGVRSVLIAADPGGAGETAAADLARGLTRQGVRSRIRLPPSGQGDWNDVEGQGQGQGQATGDAGEGGEKEGRSGRR